MKRESKAVRPETREAKQINLNGSDEEEKKGCAQEFGETCILGGFLKNDEFGLGDRHSLGLEQQIGEILVAAHHALAESEYFR
jgi:hypothetical protein